MKISLIGGGMGAAKLLTEEARQAIAEADVVFGPERMLTGLVLERKITYDYYLPADILPVLQKLKPEKAVVLFSGDSSFYSGAKKMEHALMTWQESKDFDVCCQILPGISSISYFAAKIGEAYSDAFVYSLHGKKADPLVLAEAKEGILSHERSFLLLSGDSDIRHLGEMLPGFTITIGGRFSYEDEEIFTLTAEEAARFDKPGLYVAFIKNAFPEKCKLLPLRKDEDFLRDKVPMSKEVIRHESIIALELKDGDIVYDIGSGTGSVSIEIAGLSPRLKVYAFEKKPEALALQKQNIEKFALTNITLVEGNAEEHIADQEAPDAVFVGGSGKMLREILTKLPRKEGTDGSLQPVRVVVNAVSLETIAELSEIEKEFSLQDFEIKQIAVSRAKSLGDYHLLQAENPVMICSFYI